jgi:glycosyltransferase involved in cell wall biosynthesis
VRPLVVVDADVLGRQRTGDETYVQQLLTALPKVAPDLRFAAITRRPELVPDGVEPLHLPASSQELRMTLSVPKLLRRVEPAVAHFLHALPFGRAWPAVVTVQDVSWERDPSVMPFRIRLVFKTVVPRAARAAARVLTISERSKRDIVELYGVEPEKVVVTHLGVDSDFSPGNGLHRNSYLLFVGAIEPRKQPLLAAEAATALGRKLIVVGPTKDESLAAALRAKGAELRGYVEKEELVRLYRQAACLVFPSSYEGFGLPMLEAMACGTPVAAGSDAAMREVAGDAAAFGDDVTETVDRALAERDRLSAAGLERARGFRWEETARRTAEVYREVIGG